MFNLKIDMLKGNILKSLLLFALPLLISNLFQQLYNTVDTMIIGNHLGDTSLAAIGASSAVYELLIGFALGFGNGLSVVVARSYGANDIELLKKSVAGSIVVGFLVTIAVMIVSQIGLSPLLELLNTPGNIIDEAYTYINIISLFVFVMFAYNLMAGLLRATGNSFMPLVFLVISSIIHIFLDVILIINFDLGIGGAAISTVISQTISVIMCFIYILLKYPILIPEKRHFSVSKNLYKELIGQGLSMALMVAIVSIGTVILQTAINGLGYLTIAGHVAARKIGAFASMPIVTIAIALSTFVSQNKGANLGRRIRDGVRYANLLAVGWGAIITIVLFFSASTLITLITGSTENTVIENGTRYLQINAPFYAILGILLNVRYSLQGIGSKLTPLISSIIELLGKIVFVIIFIPTLQYFGVIICEPVIWCIMTTQLVYSFYTNDYIKQFKTV